MKRNISDIPFEESEEGRRYVIPAADAVIVFYSITKDEDGTITDADFNFVARDEFDRTYSLL